MGFLSGINRNPPPTTIDYVDNEKCASVKDDVEKATIRTQPESGREPHHHDPAAEARVVRKLDFRVPVLLGALYLVSFLDRSNIGYCTLCKCPLYG